MTPLLLSLALCAAAPPQLPPLAPLFAKLQALPLVSARIEAASAQLLGVRYLLDPLGEGPGQSPDADPRLRLDAFDCQTFVETVIALANSRDAAELPAMMDDVRYDGEVGYTRRNHFFDSQWLPTNSRKGYVAEVTRKLVGDAAVHLVKTVTREQWQARRSARQITLPDDRAPVGTFALDYVPIDRMVGLAAKIPSGTVVTVIRQDRPLNPTLVSHLGLLIQTANGPRIRHASQVFGKVMDVEVSTFVRRNALVKDWPVIGFQLLEIRDARAARSVAEGSTAPGPTRAGSDASSP